MKDVVLNEVMKTSSTIKEIEDVILERVEENKKMFSEKELMIIKNNSMIVNKIYMLGILDAKSRNN